MKEGWGQEHGTLLQRTTLMLMWALPLLCQVLIVLSTQPRLWATQRYRLVSQLLSLSPRQASGLETVTQQGLLQKLRIPLHEGYKDSSACCTY
jgi:hypothetical protein